MLWLWIALGILAAFLVFCYCFHLWIFANFMPFALRAFQEKPLFIVPFSPPDPEAEAVEIQSTHDLRLKAIYLKARAPRKGVILFGLEFGAKRWACIPYCDFLRDQGYDIFTVEMRGQGDSPTQPDYEPLQWVTDFEVADFKAAIAYLKTRPDADPRGSGFFGFSKGGSAGLIAAVDDPWVRCFVTDGIFAAYTTVVPYMQRWIYIYSTRPWVVRMIPKWYYGHAARHCIKQVQKMRHCHFARLEKAMPRLAPRPLFMIHGGADNYIKPEMAQALFEKARQPKEFWLVDNAKHNQGLQIAGDEYRRRILAFFDAQFAGQNSRDSASEATALTAANEGDPCRGKAILK